LALANAQLTPDNSVAIDGDIAAIGANGANRVYVFEKNKNQQWIQKTILSLPASNTGFLSIGDFGQAISLHGNILIVGARGDETFLGSAYVYERTQDGWVEKARLTGNVRTSAEEFGTAVLAEGDIIVVVLQNILIQGFNMPGQLMFFSESMDNGKNKQNLSLLMLMQFLGTPC
jgi:hypothetical protein